MDASQLKELLASVMAHIGEKYENLAPHQQAVVCQSLCELVKSEYSVLVEDPGITRGHGRPQGSTTASQIRHRRSLCI